jgi:hypothetical protein
MKTKDIKNMGLAWRQVQEADAVGRDGAISGRDDDPAVIAARKKMRADYAAKKAARLKAASASKNVSNIPGARKESAEVQEAGTATHRPNNGQDPEQGLSPNAKKEKARTSGVGVDANDSIVKSFKAFKANSKTAKHNGGINPPGDKSIIKSTMAPAANQKTESADLVAEKKKNGMHKMPDGSMMRDDDPSMKKEMMKKKPVKAAYHGEAMDPVGKADADIDNDGDTDSTDKYLHNRRKAIRNKMKSKGKKEDAVMHGGKTGAKSEKKEKEVMAVGEDKDNAIKVPSVPRKNAGFDGKIFKKTSVLKYSKGKRIAQEPKNEGAMKRMSSGDGMDTYKKKPKDEAFSSSAIVKKPRAGDGKPMVKSNSPEHKAALKKYLDGMKSKMSRRPVKAAYHGEAMDNKSPRQMKDPKKDAMVSKGGKVKVIDKDKEKDHLKKGYVRAEMNDVPKTMKRPPMPQKGLLPPTMKKGSAY